MYKLYEYVGVGVSKFALKGQCEAISGITVPNVPDYSFRDTLGELAVPQSKMKNIQKSGRNSHYFADLKGNRFGRTNRQNFPLTSLSPPPTFGNPG